MKPLPLLIVGLLVALGLVYSLSGSSRRSSEAARVGPEREAPPPVPERVDVPAGPETVERRSETPATTVELALDIPGEPEEAAAKEAARSVAASLRITVVQQGDTENVIPGARLICHMEGRDPYLPLEYIDYASGNSSQAILTDDRGEGIFQLLSGKRLTLHVWAPGEHPHRITKELRALGPEELRDVQVEVTLDGDVEFHGVLLSGEAKLVSSASIFEVQSGQVRTTMRSDESGLFTLRTESWRRSYLHIEAPGFAPRLFPLTPPYGEKTRPRPIFLAPQAILVLRVQYHTGSWASDIDVHLSCRPGHLLPEDVAFEDVGLEKKATRKDETRRLSWSGTTDHDGFVRIEGLPAGVPLELVMEAPKEEQEHGPVTLQPGENELQLMLRSTGLLRGRLIDRKGDPIAFKELWLHRGSSEKPIYLTCKKFYDGAVATNADGGFEVAGLKEGPLLIGPTPACPPVPGKRDRTYNKPQVAPLAISTRFRSDSDDELVIRLDREKYIEGQVLRGKQGYPQPGLEIVPVDQEGVPPWFSNGDGTFRIGPLQSGTYRIRAHDRGIESLTSDWVTGRAADLEADDAPEPLVLQLEPLVGRISGRVLGPDGMPASCIVFLDRPEIEAGFLGMLRSDEGQMTESDPSSGEWSFFGVEAGTHHILARTRYGSGSARVLLTSERSETRGVTIQLEKRALLHVRLDVRVSEWNQAVAERKTWYVQAVSEGKVVLDMPLASFETSLQVPPGKLAITLFSPDGTTTVKQITTQAGKTASVAFRPRPRSGS